MTRDLQPTPVPASSEVRTLVGGESKAGGRRARHPLASNESAIGPRARAIAAYEARAGRSTLPMAARQSRGRLLIHHGLDADRIILRKGARRAQPLSCAPIVGPGDEVVYRPARFLMYRSAAGPRGRQRSRHSEKNLTTDIDAC